MLKIYVLKDAPSSLTEVLGVKECLKFLADESQIKHSVEYLKSSELLELSDGRSNVFFATKGTLATSNPKRAMAMAN